MKYGKSGWTIADKICLCGAIIGIIFWGIFNNPLLGVVISCSVNIIGSIPTFISTWIDPEAEDKLAWSIFWVSCIFTLLAMPKFTFEDTSQPISFFAVGTAMVFLLYLKPRMAWFN
jgi:hypothetical protein